MKKFSMIFLCVCMCALILAGCGKKKPSTVENDSTLVGTWAEEFFDSGYTFNSDGTGLDTFWNLTFTYKAVDGTMVVTYDDDIWGSSTYTYSVNGNVLTMTRTDEGESDNTTFSYNKVTNSPASNSGQQGNTELGEENEGGEEGGEEDGENAEGEGEGEAD